MSFTSYGNFVKFPREIRDMIYAEYFSVDTPAALEEYLETGKSEAILYVTEPDTGLLRASRALYRETQPFWKSHCQGRKLFRIAMDVSKTQPFRNDMFLTLSAETLPRPPPFTRGLHITWLSYRWLHNPRLYRAVNSRLERARIVFPNLRYFLSTDKSEMDRTTELFVKILGACSWRVPGRLNIFIEDAKWPLPLPGENVWYKRLHQGMTRRSRMRSRENQLDAIIKRLSDIISRFQKLVTIVTFTFGDSQNGRYRDNTGEVRRIVAVLKQKVRGTAISIEYV